MAQFTLAQLRTRAKARADMTSSDFIPDSEWLAFINASADELYDILIQKFGEYWAFTRVTSTSTALSDSLALPANMYRLLAVERQDGTRWLPLERLSFSGVHSAVMEPGRPAEYFIAGSNAVLQPTPDAVYSLRVTFVPLRTQLVADADALDGVSGWEEYVIVDAAIKALNKEESDSGALMLEKQALLSRIESAAERRDEGQPRQIIDVEKPMSELGRFSMFYL